MRNEIRSSFIPILFTVKLSFSFCCFFFMKAENLLWFFCHLNLPLFTKAMIRPMDEFYLPTLEADWSMSSQLRLLVRNVNKLFAKQRIIWSKMHRSRKRNYEDSGKLTLFPRKSSIYFQNGGLNVKTCLLFQTILAPRSDACQITSKLKIVLNPWF